MEMQEELGLISNSTGLNSGKALVCIHIKKTKIEKARVVNEKTFTEYKRDRVNIKRKQTYMCLQTGDKQMVIIMVMFYL